MNNVLSNQEKLRYAPQMILPEIGEQGQVKLKQAHILIVGMGGLGCAASMYLASAGIGSIVVADFDIIERSNLHRQILFQEQHIGQNKAIQGAINLKAMAPNVYIQAVAEGVTTSNIDDLVAGVDLVLDCSDNWQTRLLVNQACVTAQCPLISGAAIGFNGQLLTLPMTANSPCYQCLYPTTPEDRSSCLQEGVIGPLVGIIGSMQALEAIKLIAKTSPLKAQLQLFNAIDLQWNTLNITPDPQCSTCANDYSRTPNVHQL